jgi:hypothetical protein
LPLQKPNIHFTVWYAARISKITILFRKALRCNRGEGDFKIFLTYRRLPHQPQIGGVRWKKRESPTVQ